MVHSRVCSCSVEGIDGFIVEVEVDISYGLPAFNMVGLPEVSVRESKDRVKTAINNCGYTFPMDRLVVNLAPADIKKEGTGFDLPVAVAILIASQLIPPDSVNDFVISGELSLDGRIKPVKAVLPFAVCAKQQGFKGIIIPKGNAKEAAMVKGIDVLAVDTLSQIVDYFSGFAQIEPCRFDSCVPDTDQDLFGIDFCEVQGQQHAKRALEIAAAGFHHVLMTGPPGSGKSMLAKRLPTILPELEFEEAIEVARIQSVMGLIQKTADFIPKRPFRSPHHTISDAGLVGGGSKPVPGEISLAHKGVLFLDELPEFKRNVLEVLRQPLEDGKVSIARAGTKVVYPSQFMMVAAMNPCICGYLSDSSGRCTCSRTQIQKYQSKISGPLLDRIDIQVEVPKVEYKDLAAKAETETSAQIKKRVKAARKRQEKRLAKSGIACNALMDNRHLKFFCRLTRDCETLLEQAVDVMGFSARACHSIIRLGRTIADLDQDSDIRREHLAEAVGLRSFDRNRF